MQDAKDTFYLWLRNRIAAINPARVLPVRGVERPGVLVAENELPGPVVAQDCFRIAWPGASLIAAEWLPAWQLTAAIAYGTAGTAANGGLDRGRLLAAMDAELVQALTGAGMSTPLQTFVEDNGVTTNATQATRLWWSAPVLGDIKTSGSAAGEVLTRTATVSVWAYAERGEP